jgi:hypothetical protein
MIYSLGDKIAIGTRNIDISICPDYCSLVLSVTFIAAVKHASFFLHITTSVHGLLAPQICDIMHNTYHYVATQNITLLTSECKWSIIIIGSYIRHPFVTLVTRPIYVSVAHRSMNMLLGATCVKGSFLISVRD